MSSRWSRRTPATACNAASSDSSGLYYLATDQLGTPIATLRLNDGTLVGTQLRTPYGQARYSATASTNGGMHTSLGFTGQREDTQAPGSSGLDYFNARYYDPLVGRFTSADSVVGSDPLLDGYAYVGGMVESATDPSGHECYCGGEGWWGEGGWTETPSGGYVDTTGKFGGMPVTSFDLAAIGIALIGISLWASNPISQATPTVNNPATGTPAVNQGTVAAAKAAAAYVPGLPVITAGTKYEYGWHPPVPPSGPTSGPTAGPTAQPITQSWDTAQTYYPVDQDPCRDGTTLVRAGCAWWSRPAYDRNLYPRTPNGALRAWANTPGQQCAYCGTTGAPGNRLLFDHNPSVKARHNAGELDFLTGKALSANLNDPTKGVVACNSCNCSKGAKEIGCGPGQWDPRTAPMNLAKGVSIPWDPAWGPWDSAWGP